MQVAELSAKLSAEASRAASAATERASTAGGRLGQGLEEGWIFLLCSALALRCTEMIGSRRHLFTLACAGELAALREQHQAELAAERQHYERLLQEARAAQVRLPCVWLSKKPGMLWVAVHQLALLSGTSIALCSVQITTRWQAVC